tara:strand:- start:14671 stop:15459 length:789 start_codon:yes stop_codon:yes gene_type:complete
MLPNMFPISLVLGIMGWFDIPFDVATIMVATMTLGIAVDDTIHYLIWFKRNMKAGMNLQDAVMKTVRDTGKPIVVTSVVLFFGFSVMILSQSVPLQYFGLLTGLSMLFAIIGDLVLWNMRISFSSPTHIEFLVVDDNSERIDRVSTAIRLGGVLNDTDFHLTLFNGISNPLLFQSQLKASANTTPSTSMNYNIISELVVDRVSALGVDVAKSVDKLTLRAELFYSPNMVAVIESTPSDIFGAIEQLSLPNTTSPIANISQLD